jgi:hypothetical protein
LSQGSLVIVWIWYQSSTAQVTGVTDTASNVYQRAVGPTHGGGALSAYQQEIWYASNVNGGAGIQVTAGFSAAFTAKKTISAHEYRGVSPVNPVGPAAAAIGNSATPSSGIATTSATSLVFGAAIVAGTATAGPGFTQRSTIDFNASEDQRAAAGPVSATFAATGAVDWIAQMVTFI